MSDILLNVGADLTQFNAAINNALNTPRPFKGLNANSFTEPLGKITGRASEFQKSLEASNARVLAFGASAGAVFAVQKAFDSLVSSTINVQKTVNELGVYLNASNSTLKTFSNELFNLAAQTGTSFQNASKAAIEFARQGLSVTETLERTKNALILARISGMDFAESAKAITVALNGFKSEALESVEVIDRITTADTAFAVSAQDLAEALSRVGSSAEDANVSLSETLALVTSVAQTTGRSGSVIGNSLKSIFTRLQRPKVLDDLQELGVQTRNASGATLPLIDVLKNLSRTYDSLTDAQKSFAAETVGGVYQINSLKAVLSDLGSGASIYDKALNIMANSAGSANQRNLQLNDTLSAKLNATLENFIQLGSKVGDLTLSPTIGGGLDSFGDLFKKFSETLDAEGMAGNFARGFLKGIGGIISGPGVQLLTFTILKLMQNLTVFAAKSYSDFTGINSKAKQTEIIQAQIAEQLALQPAIITRIRDGTISTEQATRMLFSSIRRNNEALSAQLLIAEQLAKAGVGAGMSAGIPKIKKAAGFVPNFAADVAGEQQAAKKHGYSAGRVYETTLYPGDGRGGKGSPFKATVNSREEVIHTSHGSYVIPPNGFAKGFVPNFAHEDIKQRNRKGIEFEKKINLILSGKESHAGSNLLDFPYGGVLTSASSDIKSEAHINPLSVYGDAKFSNAKTNVRDFIKKIVGSLDAASLGSLVKNIKDLSPTSKGINLNRFLPATPSLLHSNVGGDKEETVATKFSTIVKNLSRLRNSSLIKEASKENFDKLLFLDYLDDSVYFNKDKSASASGYIPNFADKLRFQRSSMGDGITRLTGVSGKNIVGDIEFSGKGIREIEAFDINDKYRGKGYAKQFYKAMGKGGIKGTMLPQFDKDGNVFFPQLGRARMAKMAKIIQYGLMEDETELSIPKFEALVAAHKSNKAFWKDNSFDLHTNHASGFIPNFALDKVFSLIPSKGFKAGETATETGKGYELDLLSRLPSLGFSNLIRLSGANGNIEADFYARRAGLPWLLDAKKTSGDQSKVSRLEEKERTMRAFWARVQNNPQILNSWDKDLINDKDLLKFGVVLSMIPDRARVKGYAKKGIGGYENLAPYQGKKAGGFIPNFTLSKLESGHGLGSGSILAESGIFGGVKDFSSKAGIISQIESAAGRKLSPGELRFLNSVGVDKLSALSNPNLLRKFLNSEVKGGFAGFAGGFVPNFAWGRGAQFRGKFRGGAWLYKQMTQSTSALEEAKQREMSAGYSSAQVKTGIDDSLVSAENPLGIGVYNSTEGSLANGINLARKAGINPKTKGMAKGFVPNFNIESSIGLGTLQWALSAVGEKLAKIAAPSEAVQKAFEALAQATEQAKGKVTEAQLSRAAAKDRIAESAGNIKTLYQDRKAAKTAGNTTAVTDIENKILDEMQVIADARRQESQASKDLVAARKRVVAAESAEAAERAKNPPSRLARALGQTPGYEKTKMGRLQGAGMAISMGASMGGNLLAEGIFGKESSDAKVALQGFTQSVGAAGQIMATVPGPVGMALAGLVLLKGAIDAGIKGFYGFAEKLKNAAEQSAKKTERINTASDELSRAMNDYSNALSNSSTSTKDTLRTQKAYDNALRKFAASGVSQAALTKITTAGSFEERQSALMDAKAEQNDINARKQALGASADIQEKIALKEKRWQTYGNMTGPLGAFGFKAAKAMGAFDDKNIFDKKFEKEGGGQTLLKSMTEQGLQSVKDNTYTREQIESGKALDDVKKGYIATLEKESDYFKNNENSAVAKKILEDQIQVALLTAEKSKAEAEAAEKALGGLRVQQQAQEKLISTIKIAARNVAVLSGNLAMMKAGNLGFRTQMQSRALALQTGLGEGYTEMQSRRANLPEGERMVAAFQNKLNTINTELKTGKMDVQADLYKNLIGPALEPIKQLKEAEKNKAIQGPTAQETANKGVYNELSAELAGALEAAQKKQGEGFDAEKTIRGTVQTLMTSNEQKIANLTKELADKGGAGIAENKPLSDELAKLETKRSALIEVSQKGLGSEDSLTKIREANEKIGALQLEATYKVLAENINQTNKLEESIRQKEISSLGGGSNLVGDPMAERKYEREMSLNVRRAASSNPDLAYKGSADMLKFGVDNMQYDTADQARDSNEYKQAVAGRIRALSRLGLNKSPDEIKRIAKLQVDEQSGVSRIVSRADVEKSKNESIESINKMTGLDEQTKEQLRAQVKAGKSLEGTAEAVSKAVILNSEKANTDAVIANTLALQNLLQNIKGNEGKSLEEMLKNADVQLGTLKHIIEIKRGDIDKDPVVTALAQRIRLLEGQINAMQETGKIQSPISKNK